eukprot:CAMPEP_0170844746 /NCGR_PEP_ID=MMETSP0734-20130129/7096_1 /TAXON_ID=186038 /ORGANISM="Fragilariopsis kerguelensis, Strain L26-C5" /LENGTH=122 /DNA_ID=CAMNT_0011213283 /DNA_START=32 /DNA_END=396 /DNA_ORIENTATION=-
MMNIPTTAYRSSIGIMTRTRRQAATTVLSTSTASCSSRVMATVTSSSSSTSPLFPEDVKTTPSKRQQQHLRTRNSSSLQRNIGDETWNDMTHDIEPYITSTRDREVLQRSLRKLGLLNEMIL